MELDLEEVKNGGRGVQIRGKYSECRKAHNLYTDHFAAFEQRSERSDADFEAMPEDWKAYEEQIYAYKEQVAKSKHFRTRQALQSRLDAVVGLTNACRVKADYNKQVWEDEFDFDLDYFLQI